MGEELGNLGNEQHTESGSAHWSVWESFDGLWDDDVGGWLNGPAWTIDWKTTSYADAYARADSWTVRAEDECDTYIWTLVELIPDVP